MACLGSSTFTPLPIMSMANNHRNSAIVAPLHLPPPSLSYSSPFLSLSISSSSSPSRRNYSTSSRIIHPHFVVMASSSGTDSKPLRVMISGAPASGKGTQCELITAKYGLVHIAAGDLLRAEIASGSENGKRAKEYMDKGQLAPDEIVMMMIKDRLSRPDSQEKGWLLDGYPRSLSQAVVLKDFGFQPDIFVLLEVSEELLVERVVGRRFDPVTGKIYHLKYSPPENDEIAARLTQRFDDTEEKVKLRLQTHHQNVEAVLSMYQDIIFKINSALSKLCGRKGRSRIRGNLDTPGIITRMVVCLPSVRAKSSCFPICDTLIRRSFWWLASFSGSSVFFCRKVILVYLSPQLV